MSGSTTPNTSTHLPRTHPMHPGRARTTTTFLEHSHLMQLQRQRRRHAASRHHGKKRPPDRPLHRHPRPVTNNNNNNPPRTSSSAPDDGGPPQSLAPSPSRFARLATALRQRPSGATDGRTDRRTCRCATCTARRAGLPTLRRLRRATAGTRPAGWWGGKGREAAARVGGLSRAGEKREADGGGGFAEFFSVGVGAVGFSLMGPAVSRMFEV